MTKYKNFNISFREEDYEAIDKLNAEFVTSNKSMLTREAIHFALEHKLDFTRWLKEKMKNERRA